MDVPIDNYAGRLYQIINKIKENYEGEPFEKLAKAFNVDATDRSLIVDNYAELFRMTRNIKEDILKIQGINYERFTSVADDIMIGLSKISLNSYNGLREFVSHLDEKLMIRLEFCADLLSRELKEDIIESKELEELLNEVNELIVFVRKMSINKELKLIFHSNLENIRIAIERYEYHGTKGVKKIVDSGLGSILLASNLVKNEDERNCGQKIFDFIIKINQVISLGKNSKEIIAPIAKHFLDTKNN